MKGLLKAALALVLVMGVFSVRGVLAETVNASSVGDITGAKSGVTVVLTEDITTDSKPIEINKDLVIDLNGHKITVGSGQTIAVKVTGGNVILRNKNGKTGKVSAEVAKGVGVRVAGGNLIVEENVLIQGSYMGIRGAGGNAKLDGGTVSGQYAVYMIDGDFNMVSGTVNGGENGDCGVWVTAQNKAVEATISGGSIIMADNAYGIIVYPSKTLHASLNFSGGSIEVGEGGYAISGNGSSEYSGGSLINITSGTIKSGYLGIYHPQNGTITIGGDAVIQAKSTGIEMRSGTLNVKDNATIIGGNGPTSSDPNGNGSTTENAAIAVAQHTTNNPISVNISGGRMESTSAFYVSNPQDNSKTDANSVVVKIKDGTTVPRFKGQSALQTTAFRSSSSAAASIPRPLTQTILKRTISG